MSLAWGCIALSVYRSPARSRLVGVGRGCYPAPRCELSAARSFEVAGQVTDLRRFVEVVLGRWRCCICVLYGFGCTRKRLRSTRRSDTLALHDNCLDLLVRSTQFAELVPATSAYSVITCPQGVA